MKDDAFIDALLQKGQEAKRKVQQEFSGFSPEQLNWKPRPESWSIAQCLEHLIISHNTYIQDLAKITSGNFKMSLWEKFSPFTAICGRIMKNSLQEQVGRKMTAPKKIQPTASDLGKGIIEEYYNNFDNFLEYISKCRQVDIDKTIITSPIISIVTYNLKDAFQFLLQHEHRHINQAIRVKSTEGFPLKMPGSSAL